MKKATLRRIGVAALSDMSNEEIINNPAKAMLIAVGAIEGAVKAAVSVSGPRESKEDQE
jgi:hypothetical protein